jgi:hypothetical protein
MLDGSSNFYLYGPTSIKKCWQLSNSGWNSPYGQYFDTSSGNSIPGFNITKGSDYKSPALISRFAGNANVVIANHGIGQKHTNWTNTNLTNFNAFGNNVYTGTAAATYTLSVPPTDASWDDVPLNFYNNSSNGSNFIVALTTGTFSQVTGRTQYTLTPGQFLKLFVNTNGGVGYYVVESTNGTPNV